MEMIYTRNASYRSQAGPFNALYPTLGVGAGPPSGGGYAWNLRRRRRGFIVLGLLCLLVI